MSARAAAAGIAAMSSLAMSLGDPLTVFFVVVYGGVGWWLVARLPGQVIGWLMIVVAVGFAATTPPTVDPAALASGEASAIDWFRTWWSTWGGALSYIGFIGIALTFPSGRLPQGRWRAPIIAAIALTLAATVLVALRPTFIHGGESVVVANRLAVAPGAGIWPIVDAVADLIFAILLAFLAVAIVGLLVRYRRAVGVARLQLRWLVAALVALLGAVVFGIGASSVAGDDFWVWIPAAIGYLMVPTSIGMAISRYRLYDIDRIISRTIAYTGVTALLAGVFVGAVLGLQAVLTPFTQGQTVAVAASTLLVLALFQPVRSRLKRAVDRRFDRARYDAERTAVAFAERLRDEVDIEAVADDLRSTVQASMRPASLGLWLRRDERARPSA
jgi:hypothetical protein